MGVCTKERKGRSMKDVGGAVLAGSTPPFLGRERAAVDVDVGPERRSPLTHPRPNTAGARGVGGKEPNGYVHLPTGSSYKHAQQ